MSLLLWFAVSTLYLVLILTVGIRTFRNGHSILFFGGIVFPILWMIGTIMGPTSEVAAGGAPGTLQP